MMIALVMTKNVSYKHVNFCGVHRVCEDVPYMDDRFCKKHKHDRTNFFLKVIDEFPTKLCSHYPITCEICNKVGHLNFQCIFLHDQIMAKYCNNLTTLELYNELILFLGCEELTRKNSWFEVFILTDDIETNLKEIYTFCVVNCNENSYIANYRKMGKQIEYKRNTNERVNISTLPPTVSHDEIGDEEELPIQPISLIRSSKN
jgi:hypothetical protein